jgi:DNA-binding NtrC family response regulator
MNSDLYPANPVLLVDDETEALMGCEFMLESAGITHLQTCQDSRQVLSLMAQEQMSAVLLDLSMPFVSGQELLQQLVEQYPEVPVIILTGLNKIETAIECMRAGAFDYLVKPVEDTGLIAALKRAIELRELRLEYSSFKDRVFSNKLDHPEAFANIVTTNPRMQALFQYMETVAGTSRPVLITGETGTGKELIAQALHELSGRTGRFVALNVAGLDDAVFSDTLFGHVKGAFTGADAQRAGMIETAREGTLFLDEIGDMPLPSQIKLLRLLQEHEYFPIGADAARPLQARVIAATNCDLKALQNEGTFRTDLYFRLQTHTIALPPLHQRLDDLPILVNAFLEQAAESWDKKKPTVPHELYTLLATYAFPGNVRELEAMVFEAMSRHNSHMLSCASFREHIESHRENVSSETQQSAPEHSSFSYFEKLPSLAEAPRLLIVEAMKRAQGNQTVAAGLLGITRSGLNKAIKRYGLDL